MKTLNTISLLIIFLLTGNHILLSQQRETTFFEQNKELGGDVEILSATLESDNEYTYKIFEIKVLTNDFYYLDAWINVPQTVNGYPEYSILINGVEQPLSFKPSKENWQSLTITDNKLSKTVVKLNTGINKISIKTKAPETPNVEFIKLSKNAVNSGISDIQYKAVYEQFAQECATRIIEKATSGDLVSHSISPQDTLLSKKVMLFAGSSGQDFTFKLNIPVYYTTYNTLYFSAGQNVNIRTTSSYYEHVVELFNRDNPASYSWSIFVNSNGSLNVTAPVSGYYILRVRAYRQGSSGLVNINVNNGSTVYNNSMVSGFGIKLVGSQTSNDVDFFTCTLSGGDTRLWLEDNKMIIRAYNDDYKGNGDFNWGVASRIKQNTPISAGLVSAYSSYNPASTCDLYLGLKKSDIMGHFPNLKADDAIFTAPATSTYNCISWTGGITSYWEWPDSYYSSFYVQSNPLASFDKFYSSCGLTRSGATESNAAVALWALGSYQNYDFTHGSIRKNSISTNKNIPHGYDWESKPGGLARTMHPKDALSGSSYGNIVYYYRPINTLKSLEVSQTSTEPIAELAPEQLGSVENFAIQHMKMQMSENVKFEFEKLYQNWKKTWSEPSLALNSNPQKYAESDEYKSLINFCKKYGKATWPLFIEKLDEGDIFIINLFSDLTLFENKNLLDEVKIENEMRTKNSQYQSLPSLQTNAIRYAKKLLENNQGAINADIQLKENLAIEFDCNIIQSDASISLEFDLDLATNVSVAFYDIYGSVVSNTGTQKSLQAGKQTLTISTIGLRKGIYVVQIKAGENIVSKKITINN